MHVLKTSDWSINAQLIYSSLYGEKEVWIISFSEKGRVFTGNLNGTFLSGEIPSEKSLILR